VSPTFTLKNEAKHLEIAYFYTLINASPLFRVDSILYEQSYQENKMNRIERVLAALKSGPVDHVPTSFWFHFSGNHIGGRRMARAHIDYYQKCQPDFIKVMNDNPYYMPNTLPAIEEASDWARLEKVPPAAALFQAQLDGLKILKNKLGDEVLFVTTIFSPYNYGQKISRDQVHKHIKENPEAVKQGMQVIAESLADFSLACIETGAAGIYYSAQAGGAETFTAPEHLEFIKPFDLAVLKAVDGKAPFNLLHICSEKTHFDNYKDYPADAVNWAVTLDGQLSLSEGRKFFNKPVVGGLDNNGALMTGPEEAIRKAVSDVIDETGREGLLLGANCTVPSDINLENLISARSEAISIA
jgi:uroporphyrinogen decarboxylase